MVAATVLAGRVLDPAGHPVAHARVLVLAGPGPVPDIAQLTAADGRFALPAPRAGRYRLAAHAAGFVPVESSVEVGGVDPAPETDIVLRPIPTSPEE